MSIFGHFRALETPGGDLVASFWGPGGSSGRPLGDFGSTLYSCEGVEVILGTFWNHFGSQRGPKYAKMYVQGTSQQRPWQAAGKVYKMSPLLTPWTLPNCVRGLQNRGFHDFGNQPQGGGGCHGRLEEVKGEDNRRGDKVLTRLVTPKGVGGLHSRGRGSSKQSNLKLGSW